MGTSVGSELAIDSTRRCFYCLNKTIPGVRTESCSLYSLNLLTRYLKIDMRKVFTEQDQVPRSLLTNVQNAKLKVELCDECATLTEIFSKHYQKLELLEMNVLSCIRRIHKKLVGAEGILKTDNRLEDACTDSMETSSEVLEVVEALRKETMLKCSNKLGCAIPKVAVQKLNMEQRNPVDPPSSPQILVSEASLGHASVPEVDISHVKMEVPNLAHLPTEDNDSGSYYLPDYDGRSEESEEETKHPQADDLEDKDEEELGKRQRIRKFVKSSPKVKPKRNFLKLGTDKFDFNRATNTITCKTCSETFKRKNNFREHYKRTHLQIRYKCTACGKEFTQKSNHKRHFETAHLGIKFTCEVCHRTFIKKETFVSHRRRNDCDPETVPKHVCHCEICGTGFAHKYNLYKHFKEVHSQARAFECDTCKKKFNRKRNLDMHKAKVCCKLKDIKAPV